MSVAWPTGVQLVILFYMYFRYCQWCCLAVQGSPNFMEQVVSVGSLSLILHGSFRDLVVLP